MRYYYPYPETFDEFEKPLFEQYSDRIVVWGAGRIGGVAAHCLKKKGVKICAFCDVAKDKWGTEFCGCEVISPSELFEKYPNVAVLISTVHHTVIYEELIKNGYREVFDCTSLFLEIDFDGYDFWMLPEYALRNVEQYMAAVYRQKKQDTIIDQIFLNITTKCSLRCRDCSMFIPYVAKPMSYDAKIIMEDFNNVLDCFGHIRIVNFYGGEPMLHPELSQMISGLKDEKRIERISVITNATIVPSEELLTVLESDKRVLIRISDYGDLSSKLSEIKELFFKHGIAYEVANYTYWDSPSKIAPCNETKEELELKFQLCTACNVMFLLNRKLYLCSTGSAVNNIGAFPPSETNYVDMEKYSDSIPVLYKKMREFAERPKNKKYLDACKYCSGGHCVQFECKLPVAVQTKEKLQFPQLY